MTTQDQKWAPLWRVLQLFRSDEWHFDEEKLQQKPRDITPADEEWLASRDREFLAFAERYLEALNTDTLKAYDQTVQKTLALAGWFGLLFAALAIPLGVMKDGTLPAPRDWPGIAWLFLAGAVLMLLISVFGACRALWRVKLFADATYWFLDERFPTEISLRRERVAELIQRIPINKSYVAVKTRLYQGAIWSFCLAVCLEILGIATLFVSARAAPPKPDDRTAGIAVTRTPNLTPTVSPTEVKTATATPAPTNSRTPTLPPTS